MTDLRTFDQIGPGDAALVGGKALSLALLTAAGLPVPPGFCLTTAARARAADPDFLAMFAAACGDLGTVAVRSSATAEDGVHHSFAGQQETILGVTGIDAIRAAVERCWASLDSDRAVSYRRQHGLRDDGLAMAVVVQRLVNAEVAGVLFTRDPLDATGTRMLVEAAWGLGEAVVSGRVTPDRFHLDRESGRVHDRHVATKAVMRTAAGEVPVPVEKQASACLDDAQLAQLADLGRQVEAYHREPRDIEWAYADGRFWLLQSRPITVGDAAERERVRQEEIAALRALAEPGGTVWGRFNLAEVLPSPTPMTWAVVRQYLMSGRGGFGLMYRDLGYDPDPALDDVGIFDLVCGRPYCNLSREPRLHYRRLPFEHSFAALKADPRRALYPTPTLNPRRLSLGDALLAPLTFVGQLGSAVRRQRLVRSFAGEFSEKVAPAFVAEARAAGDVSRLDDAGVLAFFDRWVKRTLVEFARESLKPTALAALCLGSLERKLAEVLGMAGATALARKLVLGVRPPAEADVASGVRDLATGTLGLDAFLTRFGHRGSEEMELSRPRWSEDPGAPAAGQATLTAGHVITAEESLQAEPRLNAAQRELVLKELPPLHTYLGLREAAKHYLMLGYALIRRALVELDRRHRLDGGVFYLTPDELPGLLRGEDVTARIAERRRRRTLALSLEVPAVLFSDDLDAIGRPVPAVGEGTLHGVPLSAGVAEGPALVLHEPRASVGEGYILVCPSTDPAWVPLFVRARGLVMETGGVLSHGAIVAREFGLPAVAGLPGVVRQVRDGQRLRVDGSQGTVTILE